MCMLVYIIPETNKMVRVTIKSEEDDHALINSVHVINPNEVNQKDKYSRVVPTIALYELKNYGLNKSR